MPYVNIRVTREGVITAAQKLELIQAPPRCSNACSTSIPPPPSSSSMKSTPTTGASAWKT